MEIAINRRSPQQEVILMGDLNVDLTKTPEEIPNTQQRTHHAHILHIIQTHGLTNILNHFKDRHTNRTYHSTRDETPIATTVDYILTSNRKIAIDFNNIEVQKYRSDHHPITATLKTATAKVHKI